MVRPFHYSSEPARGSVLDASALHLMSVGTYIHIGTECFMTISVNWDYFCFQLANLLYKRIENTKYDRYELISDSRGNL